MYQGEQEFKAGKLEGKIDIGTLYEACPGCQGTGKESFQFVKRPCQWCRGKGKLPVTDEDGKWMKK